MKKFNGKYFALKMLLTIMFFIVSSCFMVGATEIIDQMNLDEMRPTNQNILQISPYSDINIEQEISALSSRKPKGFWQKLSSSGVIEETKEIDTSIKIINQDFYQYNNITLVKGTPIENYRPQDGQKIEALIYSDDKKSKVGDKISLGLVIREFDSKLGMIVEVSRVSFDVVIVGVINEKVENNGYGVSFCIPNISDIVDCKDYFNFNAPYSLYYDTAQICNDARADLKHIGYVHNNMFTVFDRERDITFTTYLVLMALVFGMVAFVICYCNVKLVWANLYSEFGGKMMLSKSVIISTIIFDILGIVLNFILPYLLLVMRLLIYLALFINIITMLATYITMTLKIWRCTNDTNRKVNENL